MSFECLTAYIIPPRGPRTKYTDHSGVLLCTIQSYLQDHAYALRDKVCVYLIPYES